MHNNYIYIYKHFKTLFYRDEIHSANSTQMNRCSCLAQFFDPSKTNFGMSSKLEQLAAAFMPLVDKSGPNFCTYADESQRVHDVELHHGPQGVDGNVGVLVAMHSVDAKLSFNKIDVRGAIKSIADKHQKKWKMDKTQKKDFIDTQTRISSNLFSVFL